ncbi:MAG: aminopeptidase [Spirochaetaceae bacterium]|nr:aminopeptidase [Spirochaetaceae bacterium]
MKDPRIQKLAHMLVTHSIKAKKGEKVLIQNNNVQPELIKALIREIYAVGAYPFVSLKDISVERELMLGATEEQLKIRADIEAHEMELMDCFIGFRSMQNLYAQCDVPAEKMAMYDKLYYEPVHMQRRLHHTRWVVLRYPTAAMAQLSEMSEEAFEDFFFDVCCLDYSKMSKAMDALVALMEKTDKVRIVAPATTTCAGTDINFSIKGLPAIKCDGSCNIPDGEVYTAPVKNSVNGRISYNTHSLEGGFLYDNISFEFKDGKIVKATANDTERINHVLDTDEGARYIGEFAIGVNPYILYPMKETLFDEKIAGSIHFTPGNSYDDCDNGNHSAVHWDLVLIQRPEFGGGEIYFDDVLIRKDGLFVHPDLKGLNPDNLK